MSHSQSFLKLAAEVAARLDFEKIDRLAGELAKLRDSGGRLFLLGVGGSAGNCGHAVNDFRKLCGIEAYAPTDNVSELTARANDEGWSTIFSAWLRVSRARSGDAILVFSVGGGDINRNISPNIVEAVREAKARDVRVYGIVGRDGGYTATMADIAVIVPTVDRELITPLTEGFQAVIWHCLVSHPALQTVGTKWETAARGTQ
ncbi:MAG: SIS domain-containing protein [Telmatospirillum sp.]|nr:SIS domain-containing protein [Telmatospirillum sp.]